MIRVHEIEGNGAKIPALGYGTWTLSDADAEKLVALALESGYRHIDSAAMYGNELGVGRGLKVSGLPREAIFVTTKVWYDQLSDGDLQRSVESSLKKLDIAWADLVLIHWPSKTIPLSETIRALNDVRAQKLTRHIGLSNFPTRSMDEAVRLSSVPLACNQVEYHPFLNQDRVLEACRRRGMAFVSHCPLGRSAVLEEPVIVRLAEKYRKSPAQVVLRWHVQQPGVVAIPRTKTPARIRENFEIFDFSLEDGDMQAIHALTTRNARICDFDYSPEWDPA